MRELSAEDCEKLRAVQPRTIAQAARIPGVSPAGVRLPSATRCGASSRSASC